MAYLGGGETAISDRDPGPRRRLLRILLLVSASLVCRLADSSTANTGRQAKPRPPSCRKL